MRFAPETSHPSAPALARVYVALGAAAGHVGAACRWLLAPLRRWRAATAALAEFKAMSDRELRDIGISRADLHRVAWGDADHWRNARDGHRGA